MKVKIFSVSVTSARSLEKSINEFCVGKDVKDITVFPQGSTIIATVSYVEYNAKPQAKRSSQSKAQKK